MYGLGLTYQTQERWEEAEEIGVQVLEIDSRVLGQHHPGTLSTMSSLAKVYRHQERWEDAGELGLQVLEIRKKRLGRTIYKPC
jgi:Tetratricopeptide repeat